MPAAVRGRASVAIAGLVLGSAAIAVSPSATAAPSTTILISEVYGGGGNSGAPFTNDFVELHNISTAAVDLKDWTLKYYSSSTGNTGGTCTIGMGSIAPGGFFLVQLAGSTNGVALPTPDSSCSSPNLSGTTGSVELANPAGLVDLVGYGAATDLAVRLVRPRPGGRRTPGAGAQPEVAGSSLLTVGAPGTIRGPLLLESP